MAKVYVVSFSGGKDFSGAEKYGETVFMTNGVLDTRRHEKYRSIFKDFIKNANPDEDHLLFAGNHFMCSIAMHIWLLAHDKCNVLIWDNRQSKYDRYTVQ